MTGPPRTMPPTVDQSHGDDPMPKLDEIRRTAAPTIQAAAGALDDSLHVRKSVPLFCCFRDV